MKVSFNWLKKYVKLKRDPEKVAYDLTMAGLEVESIEKFKNKNTSDSIYEIEITTNRPDWLSHVGVARELSAVENLELTMPETVSSSQFKKKSGWNVAIKNSESCPYYTGALIEGVQQNDTPQFMKDALEACGGRSINLLVDITNYVLLETGQPLHAFDADLVRGKQIIVRQARSKEKFLAIDGKDLELTAEDLVIADSERAVALAGVMGGAATEVSEKTSNVYLESAYFEPSTVRRSSRRHLITSDSSYRFERKVDPEGIDWARERALWLIQKYAKPKAIYQVDTTGKKVTWSQKALTLTSDNIQKVLGIEIPMKDAAQYLKQLGMGISKKTKDKMEIKVPSFRVSDCTRPVDLIEEVARIYGFGKIPENLPQKEPLSFDVNDCLLLQRKAVDAFVGWGLFETVTFSLVSEKGYEEEDLKKAVRIVNPQNKELCWMRQSLLPSLLEVTQHNNNAGQKDVFLFEIANCYQKSKGEKKSKEDKTLSFMISGSWRQVSWQDNARAVSFSDVKGLLMSFLDLVGVTNFDFNQDVNHRFFLNGKSENLVIGKKVVGVLGQVDPAKADLWNQENPVFAAEINLDALSKHVCWVKPLKDLPRFPHSERDLSVTVQEDVLTEEVCHCIYELGEGLVKNVELFDLFRGGRIPKGYKNLGLRVIYQADDKTLISEEVQKLHETIAERIVKKFQATFQS